MSLKKMPQHSDNLLFKRDWNPDNDLTLTILYFLAMHTLALKFKPKPHVMTPKLDLRGSLDLFVVLVNVFIAHQISFSCLSKLLCFFSWLFRGRWASLACEGCQALALTLMSLLQDLLFSNGDLVVEAQMTVSETLRAK